MQIQESILINASLIDVFAFVSSYENDVRWRTGVVSMEQYPAGGTAALGTKTREVMRFMGQAMITDGEITEYEPNSYLVFKSLEGPYPATGFRHVRTSGSGTRFTHCLTVELGGLFKLLAPVLVPRFRAQIQSDLETLRDILETTFDGSEAARTNALFDELLA